MFVTLADPPEQDYEGIHLRMATQTRKAGSSTKTKAKATPKPVSAPSSVDQARSFAETALDLPVGAVLEVSDRVADLVEPFTARSAAEKQLKSYGTRLRRTVKRTERRGTTARRRATTEARKTRNRVEREARRRRHTVETTLKRNRSEVEQRVRKVGDQIAALR